MRWIFAPVLAMSLLIGTGAAAKNPEPQIWFNPHGPTLDILDMWNKDAPWQEAAKKVQVLVLVHWWLRRQTDDELREILDYAKLHHMQIDLSIEPVSKISNFPCGAEEGYMAVGEIQTTVNTLVRLGAKVDWLDMDGPMLAGHYSPGPLGCQYSIPVTVDHVAEILQVVIDAYPHVKIMEVEPLITLVQIPTWREDETLFHILLARKTGRPVQTMQADVNWQDPAWKPAMRDWHSYLRQQNMGFSVIYNGNALTRTDADWINSVVTNIESVEGELHILPEQILFTSWDAYPLYNMPETSTTAQTWLINRYSRPRSSLQVQFVGQGARGRLTTSDGKPIANATINGYKPGVDFTKPLPVTVVPGVVPAGSVSALLGVRVNNECNCSGLNDILFGTIGYHETLGGTANGSYSFQTTPGTMFGAILGGEIVGGTMVSRIISRPGQGLQLNGQAVFPVTSNARYQLSIPAATVGGEGWFGNVFIIFIDAFGNQNRVVVVPGAGKALMSTSVTDADGKFELLHMPRNVDGPLPVTVEFDGGDGTYRSTVWTPFR